MTTHRATPPAPAKRSTRRPSSHPRGLSPLHPATAQTSLRESSGAEVHDPVS
jgi:hypothetical protein